jgi:GNAT superfamily N-acetyltransferase
MEGFKIEFISDEKIFSIIPLLLQLNDEVNFETLEKRLLEMIQNNYKCVGVYDNDRLVGISGLWILTKYYIGKHIEPDNVIIHPDYQGRGIGNLLFDWMHNYAISIGCKASELNCYVDNNDGVKFYLNKGYKLLGFHFQKTF